MSFDLHEYSKFNEESYNNGDYQSFNDSNLFSNHVKQATRLYYDVMEKVIDRAGPIIDITIGFVHSVKYGPCFYGPSQRKYDGQVSYTSDSYPGKCKQTDTRYKLFDIIDETDLLAENFLKDPRCKVRSSLLYTHIYI